MSRTLRIPISPLEELTEAASLTAEEYGALMLLRIHQWVHGTLPADDDRLAMIAHVAPDRWPLVAAVILPRFGSNRVHEPTRLAHEKAAHTHELLSDAGRKGGHAKAKPKPDESQATDLATSPALAGPKPEVQPRKGQASNPPEPGHEPAYPAIRDPEAALAWLQEKGVFPGDLDELQRLLMAGKLTPAILADSMP
jgi:uncharacterized protein YdaU (DUF1376 family)